MKKAHAAFLGLISVGCVQNGGDLPSPTTSTPLDTATETPPTNTSDDTGTTTAPLPSDALSAVGNRVHDSFPTLVYATWDQSVAGDVHVEYSFDDGVWWSSPVRSLTAGSHEEVLLGIPYGSAVTFHVVLQTPGDSVTSVDQVVKVADLAPSFPPVQVLTYDPKRADLLNAPFLFTAVGDNPTFAFIFDRQGRVVWSLRLPNNRTSLHPRVAKDGRSLYLDYNSYWAIFDAGDAGEIDQMLIDGTVLTTFDTPGLHHPFTELPDGSVAYGETAGGYQNEYLTVVKPDGSSDRLWSCEDWLATEDINEFCMSNTLNYDPLTDKYLFSMWSMEAIIEVDGTTGAVDRWFGQIDGAYAFDPANSEFWWQHGGYITDAGTLLTSSDKTAGGVETVIREYEIDDKNRVLRQVWSFGVGQGVFGVQMGEAIRLASGNTLHNYGDLPRIREVTADGEVVWDIEWDDSDFVGRSMPISDLYALAPERL